MGWMAQQGCSFLFSGTYQFRHRPKSDQVAEGWRAIDMIMRFLDGT